MMSAISDGAFSISIVGRDEVGIIATISRALYDLRFNLADANMSVLNGYFSMVLIVESEENRARDHYAKESKLRLQLSRVAQEFDVSVSIQALSGDAQAEPLPSARRVRVAVQGPDRPGLVYRFSSALADARANILDMRTETSLKRDRYWIVLEAELLDSTRIDRLSAMLSEIAGEIGAEVMVRELGRDEGRAEPHAPAVSRRAS